MCIPENSVKKHLHLSGRGPGALEWDISLGVRSHYLCLSQGCKGGQIGIDRALCGYCCKCSEECGKEREAGHSRSTGPLRPASLRFQDPAIIRSSSSSPSLGI